ncbi:MAG TPA: DedA family protein, partial [Nocardioides sp.]
RTFITVVAGATQMNRRRFWLWSFIGAVAWVVSVTALGYFLGKRFPALGDNIDLALLLIMAIFAVPLIVEWRKSRKA